MVATRLGVFNRQNGNGWLKKKRENLQFEIREANRSSWNIFRKYHYLSHNLPPVCKSFVAYLNGNPAGFIACSRFPHPKVKNITRVNRLVILPDFQGIGLGKKLLDFMADKYKIEGNRPRIITSQPALIKALKKCKKWACVSIGRNGKQYEKFDKNYKGSGANRITASFEYIERSK